MNQNLSVKVLEYTHDEEVVSFANFLENHSSQIFNQNSQGDTLTRIQSLLDIEGSYLLVLQSKNQTLGYGVMCLDKRTLYLVQLGILKQKKIDGLENLVAQNVLQLDIKNNDTLQIPNDLKIEYLN